MSTPNPSLLSMLPASLRAGPVFAAWVATPAPAIIEALARAGFGAVVLDMQHGGFDETSAAAGIAAGALAGKPVLARVPIDAFPAASGLLDAGAAGIIAPMINSAADARRLAAYAKYRPLGDRSWGPGRALAFSGLERGDYLRQANGMHLALAMIESRAALAALDEILAVPGIDGVYVGPSDLSIALSEGAEIDPFGAAVDAALDHVAARAAAAGKIAGMFTFGGAQAKAMAARGFALTTVATDLLLLLRGAEAELAATR